MRTRFTEEFRAHRKGWTMVGVVFALFGAVRLSSCFSAPPIYWGEAIHGRVVDAENGEPIEGAIVVADWQLYSGGIGHGGNLSSLIVQETASDQNGDFSFPKWGPLLRPNYTMLRKAPWLVVFKTGYQHELAVEPEVSNAFVRRSGLDGHTFALRRFHGDSQELVKMLRDILASSQLQPLMLDELLKEQSTYEIWPPEGYALFSHLHRLVKKGSYHVQP